jgi:hypothetical protein
MVVTWGVQAATRTSGNTIRLQAILESIGMHPYTLAIERFPISQSGSAHHHDRQVIQAVDDAAAIERANSIADELFSARGARVVVMVIGPTSGRPIETIERK